MANQGVGNLGFGGGSVGTPGGLPVVVTVAPQQPSTLDITGLAGNSVATWKSFTFVVAQGTCLIGGNPFPVGTYTFSNGVGTLGAISYDATASTDTKLLIQA